MVRTSCERCRKHKLKCDGGKPCARCLKLNHVDECIYTAGRPLGRPKLKRTRVEAPADPFGLNIKSESTASIVLSRVSLAHVRDPMASLLELLQLDRPQAMDLFEHAKENMFNGHSWVFIPCSGSGCGAVSPLGSEILNHSSHRNPESCALFLGYSLLYAARSRPFLEALQSSSPASRSRAYHSESLQLGFTEEGGLVSKLVNVTQTIANQLATQFNDDLIASNALSGFLFRLVGFKQRLANHYISVVCQQLSEEIDLPTTSDETLAGLRLRQGMLLMHRQPFMVWPRRRHDLLDGLLIHFDPQNPPKYYKSADGDQEGMYWRQMATTLKLRQAMNELFADLYAETKTLDPTRLSFGADRGSRLLALLDDAEAAARCVQASKCDLMPSLFQDEIFRCYRAMIYCGLGMPEYAAPVAERVWEEIRDTCKYARKISLSGFLPLVDCLHFLVCMFSHNGRHSTASEVIGLQSLLVQVFPEAQIILDDDIRALAEASMSQVLPADINLQVPATGATTGSVSASGSGSSPSVHKVPTSSLSNDDPLAPLSVDGDVFLSNAFDLGSTIDTKKESVVTGAPGAPVANPSPSGTIDQAVLSAFNVDQFLGGDMGTMGNGSDANTVTVPAMTPDQLSTGVPLSSDLEALSPMPNLPDLLSTGDFMADVLQDDSMFNQPTVY